MKKISTLIIAMIACIGMVYSQQPDTAKLVKEFNYDHKLSAIGLGNRLMIATTHATGGNWRRVWITKEGDPMSFDVIDTTTISRMEFLYGFENHFIARGDSMAQYKVDLWAYDGTSAKFLDVNQSTSEDHWITGFHEGATGKYFFTIKIGNGDELGVTDGTLAGSYEVNDLNDAGSGVPNKISSDLKSLWFKDALYFAGAESDAEKFQLYKTTGEKGNFTKVKTINSTANANPVGFTAANTYLYFLADDGAGQQLWRTDGTEGGTIKVTTDLTAFNKADMSTVGEKLYFKAANAGGEEAIYVSDGNTASVLYDTYNAGSDSVGWVRTTKDKVFFKAYDATEGQEIWCHSISGDSTYMLSNVNPDGSTAINKFATIADSIAVIVVKRNDVFSVITTDGVDVNEIVLGTNNDTYEGIRPLLATDSAAYIMTWSSTNSKLNVYYYNPYEDTPVGLKENLADSHSGITAYPIPAGDVLNFKNAFNVDYAEVYNTLGALVLKQELHASSINISNLNKGVYIIRLMDNAGMVKQNIRIIKE